jgi:hypothetical protein
MQVEHEEDSVQVNRAELIEGRMAVLVSPASMRLGDRLQDERWIKTVDHVTLQSDSTRVVVFFAEESPGSKCAVYPAGREILIWRKSDDS